MNSFLKIQTNRMKNGIFRVRIIGVTKFKGVVRRQDPARLLAATAGLYILSLLPFFITGRGWVQASLPVARSRATTSSPSRKNTFSSPTVR